MAATTLVTIAGIGGAGAGPWGQSGTAAPGVLDPCAGGPVGKPRCNLLILSNGSAWRGRGLDVAAVALDVPPLPPIGIPTLPALPPLTLPGLGSATTSTSTSTSTTTTLPTTTTTPPIEGFGPADLQAAYGLSSTSGGGTQKVAVIEAGGAPQAENDLAVYRSHFGLPPCTQASGCLQIVGEDGGSSQAPPDDLWALETAADLDAASAVCPGCQLLVVQASQETLPDLALANDTAARLGATVINNSWGWADGSDPAAKDDSSYVHPGAVTVAASGDIGYQTPDGYPEGVAVFPAASPNVVAVGGTSLVQDQSSRGWTETAFTRAGSGCATVYDKPAWQSSSACTTGRAVADVAAVADPSTGVAVYDSQGYAARQGWMRIGGTSVSSAIVAGVFGLAGNAGSIGPDAPRRLYEQATALNDVTAGSNGSCPDAPTRCNAGSGWDGPTGNGTPAGTAAF